MDKIKVLIADDIEETRNVIKKIFSLDKESFEIVGEASNGEEVLKLIPSALPDVVLMDINMPVLNGLEATEKINNNFPSVIVIIMSVQGESEYLEKAMFHGAKEYIIKPFSYDNLIDTIKITFEKYKDRQVNVISEKERKIDGKVITFFSSKGGVGKSVLSLNTSIALSREKNMKILLIDLDLQFGDISILVNQYNQRTILDLVDEGQIDSYDGLKSYLYKYNENLDMLFAPGKPEASEYIGKDVIEKIINSVKNHYNLIIVDNGVNYSDNTLYILDISEKVYFISTMEIASLKNTKLGIKVMQSLGYDNKKLKLVINRFNTSYGINKKDIEDLFKDVDFTAIPEEEKIVAMSVNNGVPICNDTRYYKLKIGRAIKALSEELII
jgi:pilus assembly protein CpaE